MPLTLRTTELQYKDSHNVYHGINAVAEKPTADVIADLDAAIEERQDTVEGILDAQETRGTQITSAAQSAVDGIEGQKNTMIASIASVAGMGTDTTLTQSGVAADAKVAGDKISEIKSALSSTEDIISEIIGDDKEIGFTQIDNNTEVYNTVVANVINKKMILTGSMPSNATRYYQCFNGQNDVVAATGTGVADSISAGKYMVRYKVEGFSDADKMPILMWSKAKFDVGVQLNDGDMLISDAPIRLAVKLVYSAAYGTSESPTTISVRIIPIDNLNGEIDDLIGHQNDVGVTDSLEDAEVYNTVVANYADGKLILYGAMPNNATRHYLCFNGQNAVKAGTSAFTKTLPSGRYIVRLKESGYFFNHGGKISIGYTKSTFNSDPVYVKDGDIIESDSNIMVGLQLLWNSNYGTSSDPSYFDISFTPAETISGITTAIKNQADLSGQVTELSQTVSNMGQSMATKTYVDNSVANVSAAKISKPTTEDQNKFPRATSAGEVEWVNVATPSQEEIGEAVEEWLDDHPEAITTVQDFSLTWEKMVKGEMGFVTPEMFGAAGDGETDDSAKLQEAILFCQEHKVILDGQGKTYAVSDIVNAGVETKDSGPYITGNIYFRNAKLFVLASDTKYCSAINIFTAAGTLVILENIQIDGNRTNQASSTGNQDGGYHGIKIGYQSKVGRVIIQDCIIKDCFTDGICSREVDFEGLDVIRTEITTCGRNGFTDCAKRSRVINCNFHDNGTRTAPMSDYHIEPNGGFSFTNKFLFNSKLGEFRIHLNENGNGQNMDRLEIRSCHLKKFYASRVATAESYIKEIIVDDCIIDNEFRFGNGATKENAGTSIALVRITGSSIGWILLEGNHNVSVRPFDLIVSNSKVGNIYLFGEFSSIVLDTVKCLFDATGEADTRYFLSFNYNAPERYSSYGNSTCDELTIRNSEVLNASKLVQFISGTVNYTFKKLAITGNILHAEDKMMDGSYAADMFYVNGNRILSDNQSGVAFASPTAGKSIFTENTANRAKANITTLETGTGVIVDNNLFDT